MPKEKESAGEFKSRVIQQFPGVFRADRMVLFCTYCNCSVAATKIFNVKQHLETAKHKEAAENRNPKQTQTLVTEYQAKEQNTFAMDLCEAFIEANIPLKNISYPSLKKFLGKYTNEPLPCESTLRQRYVPCLYEKVLKDLKEKAKSEYIWISVDETTDSEQRLVINFIFGVLTCDPNDPNERANSYLFNAATVEAANATTVAAFVNDSLSLLWPNG